MPGLQRRVAIATAALVCAGSAFGPVVVGQADAAGSFYVDNVASADCSDSTANSATTPYCTIQAAVDAASAPGDTVIVSPGAYAPFTVTASGTAAAPITVESTAGSGFQPATTASITSTSTTASALTLNGASNVDIKGLRLTQESNESAVTATGASDDTLDSSFFDQTGNRTTPVVSIGSGSSSITLSRDKLQGTTSGGLVAAQGGSSDVITTDSGVNSTGPGILLDGTTSSDVTSNTLDDDCGTGIGLMNGSTSASVENNIVLNVSANPSICGATDTSEVPLLVDGASAAGTTADYNDMSVNGLAAFTSVYSWAGTYYGTAAALDAATGQGAHDSNDMDGGPAINSANSNAPGELTTDLDGNPRVNDPEDPDTGAGAYDYYDRGAVETEDPLTFTQQADWPTQAPVGGVGTYAATVTDSWGNAVTCTYTFGDGTAPVTVAPSASGVCSVQHTFAATGSYDAGRIEISSSDGYVYTRLFGVNVVAGSAFTPDVVVSADNPMAVEVNAQQSTDGWNILNCTFDFGDGSAPVVEPAEGCSVLHTYAKPGTYAVTTTFTDSGGNQYTVTDTFTTTATYFTPVTPTRILDTRKGTGVASAEPVAPGGTVRLKIAGVDGLPQTGVAAVALNVTATDATKLGVIKAYPDGESVPDVSNVDFHANQNVANTVVVAVGSDGYVDLANTSSGTTDFVADLEGYYSAGGSSGYTAITPTRVLDTNNTKTPIPAGDTVKADLSAYAGISAAMLNVTVVDATGNGYITASPDGGSVPATSNVNYLAGQTVPNEVVVKVGTDGYVDFTNSGKGQANLIVDLSGYFTADTGDYFVPVTPERYFDTVTGIGALGGLGEHETYGVEIGGVCPPDDCSAPPEIPKGATAVAANLTVTEPTANGFLTVFPANLPTAPDASVLNFLTGQQTQNAITVGLDPTYGEFNIYNGSSGFTQVIVDVFGYYGD
jgi:PKD domain/Right handed beta helix region